MLYNSITMSSTHAVLLFTILMQLFDYILRLTDRNFYKITIMILSTTPQIEGQTIREYKGVVTGETIIGANGSMLMVATSGTAVVI